MPDAKSVNHYVDQCDQKYQDCDDVIQNICCLMIILVVDIKSANDKKQNTDNDLKHIYHIFQHKIHSLIINKIITNPDSGYAGNSCCQR